MRHLNLTANTLPAFFMIILLLTLVAGACASQPTAAPLQPSEREKSLEATVMALQIQAKAATIIPTSLPATNAPTLRPTTVPPTKTPEGPAVRLIPVAVSSSEPSGGWKSYFVSLILENQGTAMMPAGIDTGRGIVETQEGFTYAAEPVRYYREGPNIIGIPSKFRIVGLTDDLSGFDNTMALSFQVAENAHPLRVTFSGYGVIDLTSVQPLKGLSLPTDKPKASFASVGQVIEVQNKAQISLKSVQQTDFGIYKGIAVTLQMRNLNQGYETSFPRTGCYMIDGMGYVRYNKTPIFSFSTGPNQTKDVNLSFYLWNPHKGYDNTTIIDDATVKALMSNAKLVCAGDFEGIFNLD